MASSRSSVPPLDRCWLEEKQRAGGTWQQPKKLPWTFTWPSTSRLFFSYRSPPENSPVVDVKGRINRCVMANQMPALQSLPAAYSVLARSDRQAEVHRWRTQKTKEHECSSYRYKEQTRPLSAFCAPRPSSTAKMCSSVSLARPAASLAPATLASRPGPQRPGPFAPSWRASAPRAPTSLDAA